MQIVFQFKGIENLYSDLKGNFYFEERLIRKYWRKGQVFIIVNKKQIGMNTLRKLAYETKINKIILPF